MSWKIRDANGAYKTTIPSLPASGIAGQVALVNGGTNADNSSQAANKVFASPSSGGSGNMSIRALVDADLPTTLAGKTLTTPTIADHTNAQHDHSNAAGGGNLPASSIGSGTLAVARLPIVVGDGGSGGTGGIVPAASAGDAALNKVLSAAGIFSLPMFNKLKARTVIGSDVGSYSISSFSAAYENLAILFETRTDRAAAFVDNLILRFNNDNSAANYRSQYLFGTGTSIYTGEVLGTGTTGILLTIGGSAASAEAGNGAFWLLVFGYSRTGMGRNTIGQGFTAGGTSTGNLNTSSQGGKWTNTADPITSITLLPSLGSNIKQNSAYTVWGF